MMAQKPSFLANLRAATRLLVAATRFRGVGGQGNPKTGLLRAMRATTPLFVGCCASNLTVNFYTILVGRAGEPVSVFNLDA
jgi:hypothetical protein